MRFVFQEKEDSGRKASVANVGTVTPCLWVFLSLPHEGDAGSSHLRTCWDPTITSRICGLGVGLG